MSSSLDGNDNTSSRVGNDSWTETNYRNDNTVTVCGDGQDAIADGSGQTVNSGCP
jgi:hypothetical protein